MWDESKLPLYDGTFTSQLIVVALYIRLILYYIVICFGIVAMGLTIVSPFVIGYFGVRSLKIKIKNKKHHHKNNRHKKLQKDQTNGYLSRLENNVRKRKR